MGRELQKKKRRSSIPKIKLKPKSKKIKILNNSIIAANWDHSQTLSQNYKRLGLTSRLNSTTGGVEKIRQGDQSLSSTANKLSITNSIPKFIEPSEARLERDAVSGKVLRVIHEKQKLNPLNDLISSDSEDEKMGTHGEIFEGFTRKSCSKNEVIRKLEELASSGAVKKERKLSDREKLWIEKLVKKYGNDFGKMARDLKMNPMQQTPADIQRRVEKWKASSNTIANDE
ncbi:hypothetical protein Golomagni_04164 [Golovinomyces magnicellulatus]|nr:hypothetical protein Golomagni_04164 [Golovinomyces magnicellulatus]